MERTSQDFLGKLQKDKYVNSLNGWKFCTILEQHHDNMGVSVQAKDLRDSQFGLLLATMNIFKAHFEDTAVKRLIPMNHFVGQFSRDTAVM